MLRAASSFRFAARRVRPGSVRFAGTADGDGAEARLARFLAEHDLASLPPAPPPAGLYRTAARDGRWLVVSGHAPYELDGSKIVGKIADESDEELARGHRAAQTVADEEDLAEKLAADLQPGDLVVCLGAGDITQWAAGLANGIAKASTA